MCAASSAKSVSKILAVDFIAIMNQQFVKIRTDSTDINQVARKVYFHNNAIQLYMSHAARWLEINDNRINGHKTSFGSKPQPLEQGNIEV